MNILRLLMVAVLFVASVAFADEAADRAACINRLRELSSLTVKFASANGGRLPKSFDELLAAQAKPDPSLLVAPLASDKSKPSYEWMLPGKMLTGIAEPYNVVAIRSLYTMPDGRRLVAYADGSVRFIAEKP